MSDSGVSREAADAVWPSAGHELGYNGPSDAELAEQKAKREGDRAARLQARLDQTESALRAQKSRASRFKNDRDRERKRVSAGVCPCCNRTFQNLARHMAGQHPEFGDVLGEPADKRSHGLDVVVALNRQALDPVVHALPELRHAAVE